MTRRSLLTPAAAGSVMLTMLALNQVFVRQRWLFPSIAGVCIAFGVGWAARRLDVPAVLSPALSVLALVTFLGWVFHPGSTAFGVPTGETMRALGESLRQSGLDLQELAAPAEPTDALTLLATAGVFLVAVVVDMLVFRVRRPVAAGIPLLALFLVPTSLAEKANVFAFMLAATGYLCLLVAEGRDRARAWGRRLSGVERAEEFADVSHVARVGRRLGSAAVGLAIALPVALPSVGDGVFGGTGSGPFGRGDGPSRVVVISPIVEIRAQLHQQFQAELFTVRPRDGASPEYTRLTSLDEFNGDEWRLMEQQADSDNRVSADDEIPQPPEHERLTTVERTYDIEVGPLAVQWLPLPYAPKVVDIDGDWKYEPRTLSVFTTRNRQKSQGARYAVTSSLPLPTPEELRRAGEIPGPIRDRYLALPARNARSEVLEIVDRVTGEHENPYDKAMALQDFFRRTGGFKYSLNAPAGTGEDDLVDFLTVRSGYCEQFAAAMAYMARLVGIPARVAVGFTHGTRRADGAWSVTNRDAHAWPELYFPSAGWVRFEPTPRADQVQVPSWARPPNDVVPPGGEPIAPSPGATATPEPTERERPPGFQDPNEPETAEQPAPPAGAAGNGGGGGRKALGVGLGVLGAALALTTPSLVAYGTRRRRRGIAAGSAARTHAAWDTLADAAEDTGYPLRASDSPRASARRLVAAAGLTGPVAAEVERLATAEERARYARSAPPVDGLDASARAVRRALLGSLSRWRRARAIAFPASSLRRLREAYATSVDAAERARTVVRARVAAFARRRALPGRAA